MGLFLVYALMKIIKKRVKELKQKEDEIINEDEKLLNSYNNIKTIPGIGTITAIVLLHLFIKYPQANQKQEILGVRHGVCSLSKYKARKQYKK